jgi:hypothetical protein
MIRATATLAVAVTMVVCRPAVVSGDQAGAVEVQGAFADAELAFMAHVREVRLGESGSDGTFAATAEVRITDCFLGAKCAKGNAQISFSIGEGPPQISSARDYLFVFARAVKTGSAYALAPADHAFTKLYPYMFYAGKKSVPPVERYLFVGPRCSLFDADAQATRADVVKWGRTRAQVLGPPPSGGR